MNTVEPEKSYAMGYQDEKTINIRMHPSFIGSELLNLQRLYQECFLGDIFWDFATLYDIHQRCRDDKAWDTSRIRYWMVGSSYCGWHERWPGKEYFNTMDVQAVLELERVPDAPDLIRIKRIL